MKRKLLILLSSLALLSCEQESTSVQSDLKSPQMIDQEFLDEEILAVKKMTAQWERLLNTGDAVKIVEMYDDSFILYATFSNKIDSREKLINYFTSLMEKKNFKVVFNEQNPRAHGTVGVDSGLYTFSYTDDSGKDVQIPARYTFIYVLSSKGWQIAEHHSSALPN